MAFQGVLQEQAWLQAVHSMNSGSEEISSNCSLCTFCARLNFELQFFFFPSLDKPGLCMLQVHCFVPLPPTFGRTSYADKDGQGFGFAVMCLPVALYREGTPMSTGTGEQASLQHPQDYCLHFLPMSGGRQRHRESRSLLLVQDYYRSKLTKKGTSGCFKRKLSKQTVCAQ